MLLKVLILSLFLVVWCNKPSSCDHLDDEISATSDKTSSDAASFVSQQNDSVSVRYDGAQVWRIPISDEKERDAVSELQSKYDSDMWMEVEEGIDLLLKPGVLKKAEELLRNSNVSHVVLIEDLQKAIDVENPPPEEIEILQNRKGHRMTWKAYHSINDIHGYLDYLAKTYPELCSVQTIGYSTQSRPLKLIKISNNNPSNKQIWVDGGIHAREWISPATVTYLIDQLAENWEELPYYMRNMDWYILPVINPDGYEHTKYDRLWRKNRNRNQNSCYGVDLNRNFGHKWGGQGSSKYPCAETFGGSYAFSEPETAAIKNFLGKFENGQFKGYISFHSYGQYILYPWGYDKSVPADHKILDRVGKEAAANMLRTGGARYQVGSSGALLYPAAGGSDDWAKGIKGIKFAYTVELRDTGRYGFVLPAHLIEVTSKEGVAFVSTVAKAVNEL